MRNEDRIFVLEDDSLIGYGNHEELVAEQGLYAASWRVQAGDKRSAFG